MMSNEQREPTEPPHTASTTHTFSPSSITWQVTAKKGLASPAATAAPGATATTAAATATSPVPGIPALAPAPAPTPAPSPGLRARFKAVMSRAHKPYMTEVVMAVYYGALSGGCLYTEILLLCLGPSTLNLGM